MPVAASNMPDKMRLANDGLELILYDVCKECPNGGSDLQVIQCNASNVHGYAFGDGYINVLGMEIWFHSVFCIICKLSRHCR